MYIESSSHRQANPALCRSRERLGRNPSSPPPPRPPLPLPHRRHGTPPGKARACGHGGGTLPSHQGIRAARDNRPCGVVWLSRAHRPGGGLGWQLGTAPVLSYTERREVAMARDAAMCGATCGSSCVAMQGGVHGARVGSCVGTMGLRAERCLLLSWFARRPDVALGGGLS